MLTRPLQVLATLLLASGPTLAAQTPRSVPSDSLLAAISARGTALAAYDRAAWLGTDAVLALDAHPAGVRTYLALQTTAGWRVYFGQLSTANDTFLIAYEATEDGTAHAYAATKVDPPRVDTGLALHAARAIELAKMDFGAPNRPYNVAVLPDGPNWFWVYFVPAPTQPGIFPLGGDRRYRIYSFPPQITDQRQLHRSILEGPIPDTAAYSFHTAIIDDVPEDTDVFVVLTRTPRIPEMIVSANYFYEIATDGTITFRHR